MFKCPFPGCDHAAAYIILDSHAKEHGFRNMTELCRKHGKVRRLHADNKALKWAQQQTPLISKHQYDGIEAAASRMKKDPDEKKNR